MRKASDEIEALELKIENIVIDKQQTAKRQELADLRYQLKHANKRLNNQARALVSKNNPHSPIRGLI